MNDFFYFMLYNHQFVAAIFSAIFVLSFIASWLTDQEQGSFLPTIGFIMAVFYAMAFFSDTDDLLIDRGVKVEAIVEKIDLDGNVFISFSNPMNAAEKKEHKVSRKAIVKHFEKYPSKEEKLDAYVLVDMTDTILKVLVLPASGDEIE